MSVLIKIGNFFNFLVIFMQPVYNYFRISSKAFWIFLISTVFAIIAYVSSENQSIIRIIALHIIGFNTGVMFSERLAIWKPVDDAKNKVED